VITAIGNIMRKAYENGWITTRDGNISLKRRDSDILYITPSGWRKSIIHPEHILRLKIGDNSLESLSENTNIEPSGELMMHAMIHKMHRSTKAVVHLHPTNILAAMYAGWDLQKLANEFPEINRYTRVGPTVPILPVVSEDLAIATKLAISDFEQTGVYTIKFDIVGQRNHGVCAIGDNPWDAYEHIERLEHICEVVLKSGVYPK